MFVYEILSLHCRTIFSHVQAPQFTNCAANIIMYNITVMDQYSPASVTVPASMSSVELYQFPADKNTISIVAKREYTITISAISDQGANYPSDPVTISKYSWRYTYAYTYIHKYVMQRQNSVDT